MQFISHINSLYCYQQYNTSPFSQLIPPGLEKKAINPIRKERQKEGDLGGKSLQKLLGVAGEEKKGRRRFPSQVIHLFLQNSFRDQSYCAFVVL